MSPSPKRIMRPDLIPSQLSHKQAAPLSRDALKWLV